MKKGKRILISILGGLDTVFYMFTPLILSSIWVSLGNMSEFSSIIIYLFGGFSSLFRAIKIGWIN